MKIKQIGLIAALLLAPSAVLAAGPGNGSETIYDVRIGDCYADSVTVKWNLDSLMGEPTVSGSFKWTSSEDGCKLPYSTKVWLRVKESGGGYGYVGFSPVTPKANQGYGYNVTGSPSWRTALCGFNGTEASDCHSSEDAKYIWKEGYVDEFEVVW